MNNNRENIKRRIEQIRNVLGHRDTVVFIGSGLSRWSNLPSWRTFIEELAEFVKEQGESADLVLKELENNDLLLAASFGIDKLTKNQFAQFIRRACRVGKSTPHEVHRKVARLGPSCFITTNYDQLIEESLRLWRSETLFRKVTNRQVTETADIIQARAVDFIFKPHGDVDDSDSLVLTREQYRRLYAERPHVIDAMKTLLVSRPVLFIGFGLRDPDFLYVKELILSTYKGGQSEQYAIMPNVSEDERDYWRRNYGIHILSYSACKGEHSEFISILDILADKGDNTHPAVMEANEQVVKEGFSERHVLALIRYSARLLQAKGKKVENELPLTVSVLEKPIRLKKRWEWKFDGADVYEMLGNLERSTILLGNPGAGKTYSLLKQCRALADDVHNACLNSTEKLSECTIPVYIDLKLYTGDMWGAVENSLPPNVSLENLLECSRLVIILDSYNEVPREYVDNGRIEKDLKGFIARCGQQRIIIASRTMEGLEGLDFTVFRLDEIDSRFVEQYLADKGLTLDEMFKREVVSLIQKPLFFRLFQEGRVEIKEEAHPKEVYKSLFRILEIDFEKNFSTRLELERILGPLAYGCIEKGSEALSATEFKRRFKQALHEGRIESIDEMDLLHWLIVRDILVPAPSYCLAFFHQSITEYLAAGELARIYAVSPTVLSRCLTNTCWDHALFWALGFLSREATKRFISEVVDMNLELAARAAKFVEYDCEFVVSSILDAVRGRKFITYIESLAMNNVLQNLPVSKIHTERLRELLRSRKDLAEGAVALLTRIHGSSIVSEVFKLMLSSPLDYNYCTGLGRAIASVVSYEDLSSILSELRKNPSEVSKHEHEGLTSALSALLKRFGTEQVVALFPPIEDMNGFELEVLCSAIEKHDDSRTAHLLLDIVQRGKKEALFPFYCQLKWSKGIEKSTIRAAFNEELMLTLIGHLPEETVGEWALEIINLVCQTREDLREFVKRASSNKVGVLKLSLLYCSVDKADDEFWKEIRSLLSSDVDFNCEPLHLLGNMDELQWLGHVDVLIDALKKGNNRLGWKVLENVYSKEPEEFSINFEPIDWWLHVMEQSQRSEDAFWLCERMGELIGKNSDSSTREAILKDFNNSAEHRALLAKYVLPYISSLSTEDINEEAISYLISELRSWSPADVINGPLIGKIATERLVSERLVPLIESGESTIRQGLRAALIVAGNRHKKRYLPDEKR